MICQDCSAEAVIVCNDRCDGDTGFCRTHALNHDHLRGSAALEALFTKPSGEKRKQIESRGDFAIDRVITGEQGEKRYFLCGPDSAMIDGVTLNNLRAVWHLIGQVLEDES